jgi:hypothetical protein
MTAPHEAPSPPAPPEAKRPWAPPTITAIGCVQDLVHAQAKVSGSLDSDAGNPRKLQGLA